MLTLLLAACNESRRGNDSNLNEGRNEAAAEANTGKFSGETQRDAEFVYNVVESNYAEIKLAELGHQRARDPGLKQIAQTILVHHKTSLNDLKTLAQARAISVPVQEAQQARRDLERMADEPDEDFDLVWCERMLDIHNRNIDKFEKRLRHTTDPELERFINTTLAVLREHLSSLKRWQDGQKKA